MSIDVTYNALNTMLTILCGAWFVITAISGFIFKRYMNNLESIHQDHLLLESKILSLNKELVESQKDIAVIEAEMVTKDNIKDIVEQHIKPIEKTLQAHQQVFDRLYNKSDKQEDLLIQILTHLRKDH